MAKQRPNLGPVIATLNLKGGVGKTTVSAHVFREFYRLFLVPTLLIDFDPQFNLSQTVFDRARYDKLRGAGKTIMAAMEALPSPSLFKITQSTEPPPHPDAISTRLKYIIGRSNVNLQVVPGDFRLVKYSLMDDHGILKCVQDRFLDFIAKCRQGGRVTVIDCNPSSSFLSLCALRACTHILIPVRPDRYSILGVELLNKFLGGIPPIAPPPKQMILLNGIPRQHYDRSVEKELRSHPKFGSWTLVTMLHHSGVPPKLIIFNGFLVGAGAQHCQGQIRQRDRFATTMTIPTRNGDFGATRAGSKWPARRAHSTACPNA